MKRFLIYWTPVLIWAGIIFYSSSQPYEEQDVRPFLQGEIPLAWVEEAFRHVHFYYADAEISIKNLGSAGFIEFFIRKGAHLGVYMILSLLLYRAISNTKSFTHSNQMTTVIIAVLYAVSDEIHQGFTVNRTPLPADVLLDTFGVLIGVFIGHLIMNNKRTKTKNIA
ncbi:VanZ family protein [Pseudalkalibacillus sp. R45]|uniref:VanZ family protein n=1 Tax=Pseudalkalibacillus sp. R45 TaxID=3457433 RepID=UPI003FCC695E